jgi:simple sugar transport system ATP-binding protein
MRDEGCAVLVVSADLDEIFSLCDRILVMYRGRIVGDFKVTDADIEEVGRLMGGLDAKPRPPSGQTAIKMGI